MSEHETLIILQPYQGTSVQLQSLRDALLSIDDLCVYGGGRHTHELCGELGHQHFKPESAVEIGSWIVLRTDPLATSELNFIQPWRHVSSWLGHKDLYLVGQIRARCELVPPVYVFTANRYLTDVPDPHRFLQGGGRPAINLGPKSSSHFVQGVMLHSE